MKLLVDKLRTVIPAKREAISIHGMNREKYSAERDMTLSTIKQINTKQTELDNLQLACKLILEKLTIENKSKLEQFSTYAMQTIFTDRDYKIEIDIKDDTKNPNLTILLVENGVKQDIKGAVGGGIITVLGFLFQIYYLEVYQLNKVMFIDEGLKEVSKAGLEKDNEDYLQNLLVFLKELSNERQYKFITVTHDDSVRLVADKVYKVNRGSVEELEKYERQDSI